MDLKSPIPRGAKVEFYSLPAHVKQKILSNLDTKNGPLFELQQQDLQPAEEPNAVEVTKLMDYWMCGIEMFTNNFVVAFEGPKPVIKDDLTEWNSWVMSTKHRLQFEDHQMEVPIALANYHFYEEKYNLFCSKLFLTAVTRFCEKNPRSYRFEVEVIGNKIIIEEAPVADAYLGGTYFDSALTKLTDRNEKRRMFELLKCEMGDFMCVYYSPVTLVDPEVKSSEIQEEEINEIKKPLNPEKKQTFEEGLKAFLPEIYTAEEFVDTCAKSFVVTYSKVSIVDGLRYKPPASTIELIARRKDGFNPNSLLVRWPECFFSNSTGLATVLHSKGVVVEHPKIHKPVFPPSCKKHLSLASQLLQRLCKEIRSRVTSEDTKFSLVWLDDRETDGASQKMRLYKRMKPENAKRDASLFISDGMRKVVSRLKPRN